MNLSQKKIVTLHGELALLFAVIINSFGVVLMLYSGAGISAISSVPYAFPRCFLIYHWERGLISFRAFWYSALCLCENRLYHRICLVL